MRTDFLWAELTARAKLLNPTEHQLAAMSRLGEVAFRACPEAGTNGKIEVSKDEDGDLIIELHELHEGQVVINGQWAELDIDQDGFCVLRGRDLEVPLYGTLV